MGRTKKATSRLERLESRREWQVREEHLPYILGVELFEPNLAERLDVGGASKVFKRVGKVSWGAPRGV